MHLVQMLLPLYDNEGTRLAAATLFDQAFDELTQEFGGVTAHVASLHRPRGPGSPRGSVFTVMTSYCSK